MRTGVGLPRPGRSGDRRTLWMLFLAALAALAAATLFLWWRDGMWPEGEMPVRGVVRTTGACLAAAALYALKRLVDRLWASPAAGDARAADQPSSVKNE